MKLKTALLLYLIAFWQIVYAQPYTVQLTPTEGRQILWQLNEGERSKQLYQLTEQRLELCQASLQTCKVQDSLSRAAYYAQAAKATSLQHELTMWQRVAIGSTTAALSLLLIQIVGAVR